MTSSDGQSRSIIPFSRAPTGKLTATANLDGPCTLLRRTAGPYERVIFARCPIGGDGSLFLDSFRASRPASRDVAMDFRITAPTFINSDCARSVHMTKSPLVAVARLMDSFELSDAQWANSASHVSRWCVQLIYRYGRRGTTATSRTQTVPLSN